MATETKAVEPYWVRVTRADGSQQLWCVNAGKARAKAIYEREVRHADSGDTVEWGKGE
jgi:hypothetical protein